jgi:hypothetical protein
MTNKTNITLQMNIKIAQEAFCAGIKINPNGKSKIFMMRKIYSYIFESDLQKYYKSNKRFFNTMQIKKALEAYPDLIKFYGIGL